MTLKPFFLSLTLGLLVHWTPALAWGPQGHRVAGALTQDYLDPGARTQFRAILGEQSLAGASVWPDQMRSNPSPFWQEESKPWHYVTVPAGERYTDNAPPAKGDGISALRAFRTILKDPTAPRVQKQLALRFSLHIIQDLHQPLHVGNGRDRGGNDIKLRLEGKTSNLHRVWDSAISNYAGKSDTAWIETLTRMTPPSRAYSADPQTWIVESAALRDRIYPPSATVNDDYLAKNLPEVERRLLLSAMRAGAYFNALWATGKVE